MQAHSRGVSLSASSYFVPDAISSQYLNYGAAVSEVSLLNTLVSSYINNILAIYDLGICFNWFKIDILSFSTFSIMLSKFIEDVCAVNCS